MLLPMLSGSQLRLRSANEFNRSLSPPEADRNAVEYLPVSIKISFHLLIITG
jgi:hypothetical protein